MLQALESSGGGIGQTIKRIRKLEKWLQRKHAMTVIDQLLKMQIAFATRGKLSALVRWQRLWPFPKKSFTF
jgi:hypothetical protein